jgi:hypothetical protein
MRALSGLGFVVAVCGAVMAVVGMKSFGVDGVIPDGDLAWLFRPGVAVVCVGVLMVAAARWAGEAAPKVRRPPQRAQSLNYPE